MEKNRIINKLPAKTWYWLNVNEAKLEWNDASELPETVITSGDESICIESDNAYSEKTVKIAPDKGQEVTVYMDYQFNGNLEVRTELNAVEDSVIKLVQVQHTKSDSVLYNRIKGECTGNGRIEIIQVLLGEGDVYTEDAIDLVGEESSLKIDIGYVGQKNQKTDINVVANHFGKKTLTDITVSGALRDAAQKTFKGTIDFKNGSTDSVGNENETVLLLGDDIVNKSVPLILCAEENVVGNHGASIGDLDEDTLFYFESRGIDKETAENIMANAAISRVVNLIQDESVRESLLTEIK